LPLARLERGADVVGRGEGGALALERVQGGVGLDVGQQVARELLPGNLPVELVPDVLDKVNHPVHVVVEQLQPALDRLLRVVLARHQPPPDHRVVRGGVVLLVVDFTRLGVDEAPQAPLHEHVVGHLDVDVLVGDDAQVDHGEGLVCRAGEVVEQPALGLTRLGGELLFDDVDRKLVRDEPP